MAYFPIFPKTLSSVFNNYPIFCTPKAEFAQVIAWETLQKKIE